MAFMRGAKPTPRHKLAGAMPHAVVGPTPPHVLYLPQKMSMWGNDVFGDCVTAEEAFAKDCDGIYIGTHKAVKWARRHWGLNGAGLWEILTLMQTDGFYDGDKQYNDGPFKSVDWTNADLLKNAIAQGPVKIGVAAGQFDAVPGVGVSNGWVMTGFKQDGNLDHCTALCGYGPFGWLMAQLKAKPSTVLDQNLPVYAMFTWSTIGIIDEPSLLAITGEAWLRTPTTTTKPNPKKATA